MEMNILEEKKGRLVFELEGVDHTFCNALKDELWNDKTVSISTYAIEHPLKPKPKFVLEANEPKKSLKEASVRLQKKHKELQTSIKKL